MYNQGKGTFSQAVNEALFDRPSFVAAADVTGDLALDLVISEGNAISVLENQGDGRFVSGDSIDLGRSSLSVTPTDLNADSLVDVVSANSSENTVTLLQGNGDGTFRSPDFISVSETPRHVAAGDLDRDGDMDLVVANRTARQITVLLSQRITPTLRLLRGDCNGDGLVEGKVGDAVFLLTYNFRDGQLPDCLAACDADVDGIVEGVVTDAVYLLNFNFLMGEAPAQPFPQCGLSSLATDEALGCETPGAGCP